MYKIPKRLYRFLNFQPGAKMETHRISFKYGLKEVKHAAFPEIPNLWRMECDWNSHGSVNGFATKREAYTEIIERLESSAREKKAYANKLRTQRRKLPWGYK